VFGATESRRMIQLGPHVDAVRLSPDGRRVAFHAPGDDGVLNVWVAGVDGAGRRQITFEDELGGFPCWSRDGSWLALEVRRGGDDQVAVVPATGGSVVPLTDEPGKSWPYDVVGERVAFAALRDGAWEIWWVSRATREQRRLTDFRSLTGYVRYPAWSPAGNRVVFEKAENTGDLWMVDSFAE
jgi:Tol biopolymer transport system component